MTEVYNREHVVAEPTYEKMGDGQVSLEWYKIEGNTANPIEELPTNAGSYMVRVILAEGANYKGIAEQKIFTISKADPVVTAPNNITAVEGDKLSSINLPEGFEWEQDEQTSVGEVGQHRFTVRYTPEDTVNYKEAKGIEVIVTVIAKPEIDLGKYEETEDQATGKRYLEKIDNGTTIGEIQEKTNFVTLSMIFGIAII